MRRLILALDALPSLREATQAELDVSAAATLAELAGVDGVRLGLNDELLPVRPEDLLQARRSARVLELRMPPSQALLKEALEVRPDRVLLDAEEPLERLQRGTPLGALIRPLGEAGIPVAVRVPPDVDAIKIAHAEDAAAVEIDTRLIADLPPSERIRELERLGDAARLAAKLRLGVGLGGGLGYRSLRELVQAAPAAQSVAVGRAAVARALLVGLDRALRDLRALLA